jgi:FtsP/CotA-like multicopper oxidase with cupredoxin domain
MMQQNQNTGGEHNMHGGQMSNQETPTNDGTVKKIEWEDDMSQMNSMSDTKMITWKLVDQETQKENMDIKWQFKKGDKVKLKLINDPKAQHPMQHPIHVHGQRFLVLNTNGVPNQNLVWKDTVLVQTGDTVELLVDLENPGDWVLHCHIPEHMEAGMMSEFEVL